MSTNMAEKRGEITAVERIKAESNYLRGTIAEGLSDELTGALAEPDTQLTKFHGIYQQDDRDLRSERKRQLLEPAYQFMIRARVPGGVCTPAQWLTLDALAETYGNGTLRLTTRQSFQLHGVLKRDLKPTIAGINQSLLDTLAACGDVNRNVMCNPNPMASALHAQVLPWAMHISTHLTPRTTAYHEIWLNDHKIADSRGDEEPVYGKTYLPRKFKTAVAIPPVNDVDVFAQDLGFIAIAEGERLVGFDVTVGGGMGMSHGDRATYPRLADLIGFCLPAQVVDVAEKVVAIQRDYGDRTNRQHARLKYTIEDHGIDWFQAELKQRLGWALEPARPFRFDHTGDRYGWTRGYDERWHYTAYIENGRVKDTGELALRTALRAVAEVHRGDFRLTPNQNVIIAGVQPVQKSTITALLDKYGLSETGRISVLRQNAMACVGLPTCGLAMAESERYLPALIDKLDVRLAVHGLATEAITVRMTGCPNGCARPYLAEIGLVGKAPGKYNLYLGGGFDGRRLNKLYRQNLGETEILAVLEPILADYATNRAENERFGDFVIRRRYVAEVTTGKTFHD